MIWVIFQRCTLVNLTLQLFMLLRQWTLIYSSDLWTYFSHIRLPCVGEERAFLGIFYSGIFTNEYVQRSCTRQLTVSRNKIIMLKFSTPASHSCYLLLVEYLNIVNWRSWLKNLPGIPYLCRPTHVSWIATLPFVFISNPIKHYIHNCFECLASIFLHLAQSKISLIMVSAPSWYWKSGFLSIALV